MKLYIVKIYYLLFKYTYELCTPATQYKIKCKKKRLRVDIDPIIVHLKVST